MTLNEAANAVAATFGEEYNDLFKERIKYTIKVRRATFIRRDAEKSGLHPAYMQRFSMGLSQVDRSDEICTLDIDCPILRTTEKVPMPIRTKGSIFKYVGQIGGLKPFGYVQFEELPYFLCNRFIGKQIVYTYSNNFIYVFNKLRMKNITVESAFEEPEEINICADPNDCYNDDESFPLPADMMDLIIESLVSRKYPILIIGEEDEEVEHDSEASRR